MALNTVAELVGTARVLLQDKIEPYRYEDDELLVGLNAALLEARRLRPDLFINRASAIPSYSIVDSTEIAFPEMYWSALLYYIVGHAQLRDEESGDDPRSMAFLNKFTAQLMTAAA